MYKNVNDNPSNLKCKYLKRKLIFSAQNAALLNNYQAGGGL